MADVAWATTSRGGYVGRGGDEDDATSEFERGVVDMRRLPRVNTLGVVTLLLVGADVVRVGHAVGPPLVASTRTGRTGSGASRRPQVAKTGGGVGGGAEDEDDEEVEDDPSAASTFFEKHGWAEGTRVPRGRAAAFKDAPGAATINAGDGPFATLRKGFEASLPVVQDLLRGSDHAAAIKHASKSTAAMPPLLPWAKSTPRQQQQQQQHNFAASEIKMPPAIASMTKAAAQELLLASQETEVDDQEEWEKKLGPKPASSTAVMAALADDREEWEKKLDATPGAATAVVAALSDDREAWEKKRSATAAAPPPASLAAMTVTRPSAGAAAPASLVVPFSSSSSSSTTTTTTTITTTPPAAVTSYDPGHDLLPLLWEASFLPCEGHGCGWVLSKVHSQAAAVGLYFSLHVPSWHFTTNSLE